MKKILIIALVIISSFQQTAGAEKLWSILICTLEARQESFNKLYNKLTEQITSNGLEDQIEIRYFKDNKKYSIGYKRDSLLQESQGKYINFIDDDDDIHDNYIAMIYERLLKDPDVVSLTGIITINNHNPRIFIHSIKYDRYFGKNNIFYRPPNHLNPIRRSIAIQFAFPDKSWAEDTDWAMQIARSKLLKTEEEITTPYYFYKYLSAAQSAMAANNM